MRTKVWEEAERMKQDGTKAEADWISFFSKISPQRLQRTCVFFRIVIVQHCPGSSAGQ